MVYSRTRGHLYFILVGAVFKLKIPRGRVLRWTFLHTLDQEGKRCHFPLWLRLWGL